MKVGSLHDFSDDSVCRLIFHIAKVSHSPSHIHVRVTLVIRWLFAARFVDVAGLWNFQVHGWNFAEVAFLPRRRPLLCHGEASQTVRHSPADSTLQEGPEFWKQQYHDFITAHVGSPRDTSLDTTTGSVRRCCAVRVAGSACLPKFQEHGR